MFEMCMLLLSILKDCSKTESFGGSIALILKQIFQKILIFCTGIITIYKIWEEDKASPPSFRGCSVTDDTENVSNFCFFAI